MLPTLPPCVFNAKHSNYDSFQDTKARLESIADELHSARISKEAILESHQPQSVKRNETKMFQRGELIEELGAERKHLRYMMKLHFIDVEFHDANRTSKQHMECVALHGYRTFLWTSDARVALEREHSRLVARMVATEVAGDILEWMLEGWHFGERQSQHDAVGYVPSIKKAGMIKAGIDAKVIDSQQPRICGYSHVARFLPSCQTQLQYMSETTITCMPTSAMRPSAIVDLSPYVGVNKHSSKTTLKSTR